MEVTSTKASLVHARDFPEGVTATLPREEFAAALASEEPAELFLEVTRPESGDKAEVAISWDREELERLLATATGSTVTLTFDRDQLEGAIDPEVEMHGFREKALILTVAAAAAGGGATSAAAANDEAGSTARGITPSYLAVHDEATLAARGIESVAPAHDEATLVARGIEQAIATSHDEASLVARGIEPGALPASHDEASLVARGIEPTVVASHDEASLVARGIEPGAASSAHDEATLVSRGIAPAPATPAGDDGGFAIDMPVADATTAAVVGGLAGLGLLITAAGFATRRQRSGHPA